MHSLLNWYSTPQQDALGKCVLSSMYSTKEGTYIRSIYLTKRLCHQKQGTYLSY